MQLVIRRYRASDKDAVLTLFSDGNLEHIQPCFYNAMSQPLHLGITLGVSAAGYLLAGGSLLWALVLGGCWVGLVFYCCYELYGSFVQERLRTDMLDIPSNYLAQPDCCFWVAEADVMGRAQVLGMVAVVAKQSGAAGEERYGELLRMNISSSCRRTGLGSRMTQTVVDFCKERGFSKVVLETSSTQTAAVALYQKMGFAFVHTDTNITHAPVWMTRLTRVTILKMEKQIQG